MERIIIVGLVVRVRNQVSKKNLAMFLEIFKLVTLYFL